MSSVINRIWNKDTTVWKGNPDTIRQRLGWLDCVQEFSTKAKSIELFAKLIPYSSVVLLGMGGSSLVSRVFSECISHPVRKFFVLDTTDPSTILSIQNKIALDDTLFIVASKSGTTIEVDSLRDYFFSLVPRPEQFVAITDFNTQLMRFAEDKHFRHVFINPADIGGRFAALSYVGLVPFALMGGHIEDLLSCAKEGIRICKESINNPAFQIAEQLFRQYRSGKNKMTMLSVPCLKTLPQWIEQLIAESTGKSQKGIFPVIEDASVFEGWDQRDRCFVSLETSHEHLGDHKHRFDETCISRKITKTSELGSEFFIWEFATAILGAYLEINPFDEPDVVHSKRKTWSYLKNPENIVNEVSEISVSADKIADFIGRPISPEFIAVLSYINPASTFPQELQTKLQQLGVAVVLNSGPAYLHSTGQFHKGGPNQGRFIIMIDDQPEIPIPGRNYGFQVLKLAQALGDYKALQEAGRKVIMVKI